MAPRTSLTRFLLIAVLAAVMGPATVHAQADPTLPDSPTGALLREWLGLFNAADSTKLDVFATTHCPTCKASAWMQQTRETGGMRDVRIVSAEPSHILFAARGRSAAISIRGSLQLAAGDASKITSFGMISTSPSAPTGCTTQTSPSTHGVSPSDVASEDAIIAALYDVISGPRCQHRDWDRFRGLFAPGGRLIPKEPLPPALFGMNIETPEEFADLAKGDMEKNGFFEKEVSHTSEEFNGVVHRFSTYESRRAPGDATPFARGINSIQLLNDGTRWWLVTVYWAAERPGTPIPERYLKGR